MSDRYFAIDLNTASLGTVPRSASSVLLGAELGWNPFQDNRKASHARFGWPDLAILAKTLEKAYRPKRRIYV